MERHYHLSSGTEQPQRRTPWISVVLASAAMLPMVGGAVASRAAPKPVAGVAGPATLAWAAAILLFLAGVRRGLAFREPGGPTPGQLGAAIGLFLPGLGALLAPRGARGLLMAGYAGLALLDPLAARQGEAPAFFSRLRPVQAGVAVLALLAVRRR